MYTTLYQCIVSWFRYGFWNYDSPIYKELSFKCFHDTFKRILKLGVNSQSNDTITSNWCRLLLEEVDYQTDSDSYSPDSVSDLITKFKGSRPEVASGQNFSKGLLSRPYHYHVARNIWYLIDSEARVSFPSYMKKCSNPLLSSDSSCLSRIEELEEILEGYKMEWSTWFKYRGLLRYLIGNNSLPSLQSFLFETLTLRDLGLLVGLCETEGSYLRTVISPSQVILWPSFEECIKSFCQLTPPKETKKVRPNIPQSQLTVGGRALCKHSHRDGSSFWPTCNGTEKKKNELANTVLVSIINEAVWFNLHLLPGRKISYELRHPLGYGARWELPLPPPPSLLLDSDVRPPTPHHPVVVLFRGFLEPQMVDGHDLKWRHG